jgi:SAM-dependent methyltransferase
MQDEHAFVWEAMIKSVGMNLGGSRVLDIGCNRGGFLRMLSDRHGIAEGFGYDPAAGAVADARHLAGDRPLHFETADRVPPGWDHFAVAFSHEVLYLVNNLSVHAHSVFGALAPGGSYYAVMGAHASSPLMVEWHREHAAALDLPPLRHPDRVVAAFVEVGFEAAASRLEVGFVPLHGHSPKMMEWLDYYYEKKLLLRFTRPGG